MTGAEYGLPGRTAVVTGSSRGIGREIAETFARTGANVVVCAPESEAADMAAVADGINDADHDGRAMWTPCDVTDRPSIAALADATVDEFGGVDVLVNNAGGGVRRSFRELDRELWDSVLELNLGGTFNCSDIVGDRIVDGGGGAILNVVSMAGLSGMPKMSHYAAAKAAIINFTRTLSFELATFDVRVNAIAPGLIARAVEEGQRADAPIPSQAEVDRGDVARRVGLPEEVADMALVLASPAASFVTGHTMAVAGVPRLERSLDVPYYGEDDNVWVRDG